MRVAAYVYPGWHPIAERDASFHPGFTEWELVAANRPRFAGHSQPRVPMLGAYDDRDPREVGRRLRLARSFGVDGFVYGVFWCRGKRVFESALDDGYLGSREGNDAPFAVMWANRMPRRVLPVRRDDLPVVDGARRVSTDLEDFVEFVATMARAYFARCNYLRVDGRAYLSIFDSTFFVRTLGLPGAREAIRRARAWLRSNGFPDLYLAAIDPAADTLPQLADIGFDSVTHYVFLPDWKGPYLQDYASYAARRASEWQGFALESGLPYTPSIAPGWDATPRGVDFGTKRMHKYPWSPVVVGEHPERFFDALERGRRYCEQFARDDDPLLFVASLNEWSEGHYLEPDTRFGTGWLGAVAASRVESVR